MLELNVIGKTPNEMTDTIKAKYDHDIYAIINKAKSVKNPYKGTIQDYQAAWLYVLAKQYNKPDYRILEIGTGKGYSTSFLALACPDAHITSISIRADEQQEAKQALDKLGILNVELITVSSSWEWLASLDNAPYYDMIFVDGDHNRVSKDLAFWDELRTGGLFLFHDYCPDYAANPQPIVFNELNKFKKSLDRTDFDVLIVDNEDIGMAGLYK